MNRFTPTGLPPPATAAGQSGYETDFTLWTVRQAELLRAKKFEQIDLDNLVDEVAAMGRNEHDKLGSRIETLLMHLLKCQFQPEHKSGNWLGTLREQRSRIARLIRHGPSLDKYVMPYADESYPSAADRAAAETGLPRSTFPIANPYSREQILDPHFGP